MKDCIDAAFASFALTEGDLRDERSDHFACFVADRRVAQRRFQLGDLLGVDVGEPRMDSQDRGGTSRDKSGQRVFSRSSAPSLSLNVRL